MDVPHVFDSWVFARRAYRFANHMAPARVPIQFEEFENGLFVNLSFAFQRRFLERLVVRVCVCDPRAQQRVHHTKIGD